MYIKFLDIKFLLVAWLFVTLLAGRSALGQLQSAELEAWLTELQQLVPLRVTECTQEREKQLAQAADAVERWAIETARFGQNRNAESVIAEVERLAAAQQNVDEALTRLLELRSAFAASLEPSDAAAARRAEILAFLKMTSGLIDLSGRMRYQMRDALDTAAYRVASRNDLRDRLIDALSWYKSDVGADVMAAALFDPPPRAENNAVPATPALKSKLLQFIATSGQASQVYILAEFVRDRQTPPEVAVRAAAAIQELGLPQDPRPENSRDNLPAPAITAAELHGLLARIPEDRLASDTKASRNALLKWLAERRQVGLESETYRLGTFEVQPGDWLLMRNPSPYNLFTDLSPGLFTHVGVVAMETGSDGRRRMVLVDLPERGAKIPATNVEIYVQRSLHYLFLRHPDPVVAAKMAQAATSIIGNDCVFDLNFRTDRVLPLKGKPLRGQKIHTFCTGLLLLCSQETTLARERLFPIPECVGSPRMAENLAKMGVSIGQDFVSPTSALFSPELQIAGRVSPYYDPGRQIEEGVFDHFSLRLREGTLELSLDTFQAMRLKLAEAAKNNPSLAKALASAANVSAEMDLVAAARTGAVVETLDEIAFGNSRQFRDTWFALTCGPLEQLPAQGYTAEQIAQYRTLRQKDGDLFRRMEAGAVSPRNARITLVDRFLAQGRGELDKRFFTAK